MSPIDPSSWIALGLVLIAAAAALTLSLPAPHPPGCGCDDCRDAEDQRRAW